MTKILVTSALPYANGSIHVGHLLEYIETDIFVRFLKLKGEDVIYCCADDAHGTPIQVNAEKLGITPKELIDKSFEEHVRDFKRYLIDFDSYYTTDSPENKMYSDLIFSKLKEKGLIIKKTIDQMYCPKCKRFLPDRFIKGKCPKCGAEEQYGDVCEKCGSVLKTTELINPKCAVCGTTPVKKKSEHYFFQLSKCEKKISKWIEENKNLQEEVKNYVRKWISDGLEDWDISRDGPYFGFKIPGETDKYYYVWLDAPIGYIASTEHYCKERGKKVEDYWNNPNSKIIHFIGKDIVYFHLLFWPAMLMESGFNLPNDIIVHGYLTVNGEKMSKSRGTFLTAQEFADKYKPEYLRYYYATLLSRKIDDVDLNISDLVDRVNNELVANLGNFCYRTISFANKNFDSIIGANNEEKKLVDELNQKIKAVGHAYEALDLKTAAREIMAISSIGNKYFQDNEPWKLIKTDKARAEQVIGLCLTIAKNLSILARPILPIFSNHLEHQLGLNVGYGDLGFKKQIFRIKQGEPLIQKIEKEAKKEVFPLDLKVAEITSAQGHPEAEKLVVMQIDLGKEKRQIVAGIRKHYSDEELLGKHIVVVTNLKPTKLRGFESNGMLLAAQEGEMVELLLAEKSKPGEQVAPEGFDIGREQISIEEFSKLKLTAKNQRPTFNGKELKAGEEEVVIAAHDGAVIR
ncbi:MAG: methionine--tRNA ligase [Candidatus Woesearchaeota archaeon]